MAGRREPSTSRIALATAAPSTPKAEIDAALQPAVAIISQEPGLQQALGKIPVPSRRQGPALLDDMLTKEELAEELDTCVRTLDRWHQQKIGPPRTIIGRKLIRFRRAAVEQWLLSAEGTDPKVANQPRRRGRPPGSKSHAAVTPAPSTPAARPRRARRTDRSGIPPPAN
jgi:Helix-turn-helix domain